MEFGEYDINPKNVSISSDLISFSGAYESFIDKEDGFRFNLSGELLLPWGVFDQASALIIPYAAIGYNYLQANNHNGHGPSFRVMGALPKLNAELGYYIRYIGYHQRNDTRWRLGYGLRADYGFGLVDVFLTGGQEYLFGSSDNFQRGPQVAVGVEFAFPASRISSSAQEKSLKARRWVRDRIFGRGGDSSD